MKRLPRQKHTGNFHKQAVMLALEQALTTEDRREQINVGFFSHETIYSSLFIQARGYSEKMMGHLRSERRMRRSKCASIEGAPVGQIIEVISIRDRPADVKDRAIPDHWKAD